MFHFCMSEVPFACHSSDMPRLFSPNIAELYSNQEVSVYIIVCNKSHLPEEGTIELDDVGAVTAPHHHIKIHQ